MVAGYKVASLADLHVITLYKHSIYCFDNLRNETFLLHELVYLYSKILYELLQYIHIVKFCTIYLYSYNLY